jgi:glutamine synthetase
MTLTPLDSTRGDTSRSSLLAGVMERIRAEKITHVYLQYTSVPGRLMGKVIPAPHFARVAEDGLAWTYLSAGGFAGAVNGELIGPTGAVAKEGLLLPDLATFQPSPWDPEVAWVFCDHFHRPDDADMPGAVVGGDCRANLKRLDTAFREEFGLELKSGCEPEMSWFPDVNTIAASVSHLPAHISTAYHIGHIERMSPILKRLTLYAQQAGLDMIQADYEDPGQIEMNFMFGPCLLTADRLITYRQICMQVAREFGVFATFMPKPLLGVMANGCHHHLSLWRGEESAFGVSATTVSDIGRWAIGGLLTHARGMSAVVAQTVNSYVRYWDTGLFAPTAPLWGYDNRLCIARVLPGRVEYRAPDASCNPYLTHAVMLAAIADGIRNQIDPGPPAPDDAAALALDGALAERFSPLPRTLDEAVGAFEEDEVIRSALPPELCDTFLAIKRDEWQRACGTVTDWQRETYLRYLP